MRAKRIIQEQGVTSSADCLPAVHTALYLLFDAGNPAGGEHCEEAIRLVECLLDSGLGTAETQALRASSISMPRGSLHLSPRTAPFSVTKRSHLRN